MAHVLFQVMRQTPYITLRDTINHIVYGAEARMEEFVFNTIDSRGNLLEELKHL